MTSLRSAVKQRREVTVVEAVFKIAVAAIALVALFVAVAEFFRWLRPSQYPRAERERESQVGQK